MEEYHFYCSVGTDIQYNTTKLSWHDARDYCRDSEGVLATVTDQNKNVFDKTGWIGLFRVGGETWQWETGEAVNYTAWGSKEPVTYDCGTFNVNSQKWQSYQCSEHAQFICFKDNLVVVKENKTWEEALEHCKSLNKKINTTQLKLLTIDTKSEYNYVRERIYGATTEEVSRSRVVQAWFRNTHVYKVAHFCLAMKCISKTVLTAMCQTLNNEWRPGRCSYRQTL